MVYESNCHPMTALMKTHSVMMWMMKSLLNLQEMVLEIPTKIKLSRNHLWHQGRNQIKKRYDSVNSFFFYHLYINSITNMYRNWELKMVAQMVPI